MKDPNQLTHSIIGYGALGAALVHTLEQSKFKIASVISSRAKEVKRRVPQVYSNLRDAPIGQIIWICTPDDSIRDTARKVGETLKKQEDSSERVLIHCSGTKSLEPLKTAQQEVAGLSIASLHPLQTFTKQQYSDEQQPFAGCYASVLAEDDETAEWVTHIARLLQLKPIRVEPKQRQQIHLSATIACNYMVSLMHAAESALPEGQSIEILQPLLETTLNNILKSGPSDSLSGPIKRKDVRTIQQHLEMLRDSGQADISKLYADLGKYTATHLLEDQSHEVVNSILNVIKNAAYLKEE